MRKDFTLRWITLAVVVAATSYSCFSFVELWKTHHPLPYKPLSEVFLIGNHMFAHNGGGEHAPPNTLDAIRFAAARGATGIEVDLQMTRDHRLIAFHDHILDYTTNGTGFVEELLLAELQTLNPAHSYCTLHRADPTYAEYYDLFCSSNSTQHIPTFEEVADLVVGELHLPLLIEVKTHFGNRKDAHTVAVELRRLFRELRPKLNLHRHAAIMAFHPDLLYEIRRVDPEMATVLLFSEGIIARGCREVRAQMGTLQCLFSGVIDWIYWHAIGSGIVPRWLGLGGLAPYHTVATPDRIVHWRKVAVPSPAHPLWVYVWGVGENDVDLPLNETVFGRLREQYRQWDVAFVPTTLPPLTTSGSAK